MIMAMPFLMISCSIILKCNSVTFELAISQENNVKVYEHNMKSWEELSLSTKLYLLRWLRKV